MKTDRIHVLVLTVASLFWGLGCAGISSGDSAEADQLALKGGIPAHSVDGGPGRGHGNGGGNDGDAVVDEDVDEGVDEAVVDGGESESDSDDDADEDADEGADEGTVVDGGAVPQ